jgi:hypothetical protein
MTAFLTRMESDVYLRSQVLGVCTVFTNTFRERPNEKGHLVPFQKFRIEMLQYVMLESEPCKGY